MKEIGPLGTLRTIGEGTRRDGVRRKLGDCRGRPRYDIVGDLWGTLETVLRMPLRNVGPGGALIESHVALPAESIHRLTFTYDGQDASTQVRIHTSSRRSRWTASGRT